MKGLAAAELFVLALLSCGLLSSLVWLLLTPRLLRAVDGWEAVRRHVAVFCLALAPLLTTTLLMLAALTPSLLSIVHPGLDHCLQHDDGHAHLCFLHPPQHAAHVLLWVAISSVSAWALAHALLHGLDLWRAHRRLRALIRSGSALDLPHATLIEDKELLCATAGLFFPRVLVSRQLLALLNPVQRQALLAHETAHVRRRDALSRLVAKALAALYPRAIRQRITHALELAAEQTCDEEAARVVGDRLTVAETILRVERAVAGRSASPIGVCSVGMQDSDVERRVETLLDLAQTRGSLRPLWLVVGVMVALLFLAADELHHTIESLLSPLLS